MIATTASIEMIAAINKKIFCLLQYYQGIYSWFYFHVLLMFGLFAYIVVPVPSMFLVLQVIYHQKELVVGKLEGSVPVLSNFDSLPKLGTSSCSLKVSR